MQVLKKPGVKIAKVLIGTPSGDIHDIGKDIVACTLKSNGYDVIDLGIDVSADSFVNAVMTHQPDIVAVGCMNPESFEELKNIIKIIKRKDNLRADIKILICGNKKLAHSYKDYGEDAVVIWIQIVRHKNNMPVAYEDKYLPYQKGFPIIESLLHHVE